MHVAGCYNRFIELLAQPDDLSVHVLNVLHRVDIFNLVGMDHEHVVAGRLDFQIIIKFHDPRNFRIRLFIQQGTVQLACLTRTAQNQSLPVLHQQALRNSRCLMKVSQMRLRYQTVQIYPPHIVFRKDNRMVGKQSLYNIRAGISQMVHIRKGVTVALLQKRNKFYENFRRCFRIVHCAVMIFQGNTHRFCDRIQRMLRLMRQKHARNADCIHISRMQLDI